ncbi:hypothetical protein [Agromyces sp. Soil535]|uniref:hypothetical protein n=1 Tax=Agromyces sp. Soil535 TaxID=1736390 RepID=UPI00070119C6|nr:hypothetical protein [Agromyces sp. Soil535]KRE25002.1 hypothetical protein ASG80_22205 [Agromyces sp. Soil535]
MPNTTTRRLALNFPLLVLWVASVGVGVLGYFQLQGGNSAQADFYNTQGSDYLQFLNLQTQSTIGGMLLIAGIVGVFLALAIHGRNRAAAILAENAALAAAPVTDDLYEEFDDLDEADESGETAATDVAADGEPADAASPAAEPEPADASADAEPETAPETPEGDEAQPRA